MLERPFDPQKFIDDYNEGVLKGEKPNMRTFRTLDVDGQDDFSLLFHPENKKIILKVLEKVKETKEILGDKFTCGFSLFGSRIKGVTKKDSDFDISLFSEDGLGSLARGYTELTRPDEPMVTIQSGSSEKEIYEEDIKMIIRKSTNFNIELAHVRFLLLGIPFGKELQDLQKNVLDYISNLNDEDRQKVWSMISENIFYSERGDKMSSYAEQKYGLIDVNKKGPLTFEEFKERLERRAEFANYFCAENGVDF